MDIAGISSALTNMRVQSQVGTAILSKTMDTNETLAAGMIEMIDAAAMEKAATPWVGGNFDVRI